MKKVEAWQTTKGEIFLSKRDAYVKEAKNECDGVFQCFNERKAYNKDEFFDFIVRYRDSIQIVLNFLSTIDNLEIQSKEIKNEKKNIY